MSDEKVNSYEAMAAAAESIEEERRRKIQAIQRKRTIIGLTLAVLFLTPIIYFNIKSSQYDVLMLDKVIEVRRNNFINLKKPKSLYP